MTKSLVSIPLLCLMAAATPQSEAGQRQAGDWLALVDAGKYAASWDAASSSFRKAIAKDKWVEAVTAARKPLGKIESRKLETAQPVKDPPNAPPGDYIILQFASDFEKKANAVETVVMVQDDDKQWRTSGYFVK